MRKVKPTYTLYRPKESIYRLQWDFHKYDDDFFPSVPHGHSLDGKYKLSIWDGAVYSIQTGKRIGIAKKKEMKKLYNNAIFREFVNESIKWYEETHSCISGCANLKHRRVFARVARKTRCDYNIIRAEVAVKINNRGK